MKAKYSVTEFAGGENAPLGYGPPLLLKQSFRLLDWARDDSNKRAWEEIMRETNGQVKKNLFKEDKSEVFMGDFAYLPFDTLSMNKGRRFGFCGLVDTLESFFEMFQELEKLGIVPPMKVGTAQPLI